MNWSNWSGSVKAHPKKILHPNSEEEIAQIVVKAGATEQKIRVVGSGHSFSPLVHTNDILLSLDNMQGLIDVDKVAQTATVWAGTKLRRLGALLHEKGLAQENMGDIDAQSIAGALSTGTHGTGVNLGTLSTQIHEITFVNGLGEIQVVSLASNPALFKAAQVSIGTLGIITKVKLNLSQAYKIECETAKMTLDECMARLPELKLENRNFEFFWFPHTAKVQIKKMNSTDAPAKDPGVVKKIEKLVVENWLFLCLSTLAKWIPSFSRIVARISAWGIGSGKSVNWSFKIYATPRLVKFQEMEYNVPAACFEAVMKEIKSVIVQNNIRVHFPIECRFVKRDEITISPAYQRDGAYIAVHQFKGMPYKDYFAKCEAIFRKYDGRPHWGKINTVTKEEFASLYPKWEEFNSIRKQMDPKRIFLNNYLEQIF